MYYYCEIGIGKWFYCRGGGGHVRGSWKSGEEDEVK